MALTLDAKTTESRARQMLDNRITSVRKLVAARQALDEARDRSIDAESEDAKAYRAALTDGWSADELHKLGLDEPDKKQRARRRAGSRRAPADTSTGSRPVDADAADNSSVSP